MLTSQIDIIECYSDAPFEDSDITALHYTMVIAIL